jgi:hypothetical protein
MEIYINQSKKSELEDYYGVGSKIEICSLTRSETSNKCIIESKVILGKEIIEDYLQPEFADFLVQKAFHTFYPEFTVKTIVKFDS